MDLCWHELDPLEFKCKHCPRFLSPNRLLDEYHIDFFTWEGFGILWVFILKSNRSTDFWEWLFNKWASEYTGIKYITTNFWQDIVGLDNKGIINSLTLAKLVVEFFEEK